VDLQPSGVNQSIIQFGLDGDGNNLRLAGFNAAGRFQAYVSSVSTTFILDTWYHVAVSYDGTDLQFYADSELDDGTPLRAGPHSAPQ